MSYSACQIGPKPILLRARVVSHRNTQIRASFSCDGDFLVCGSDDGWVYLWDAANPHIPVANPTYKSHRRDKNGCYECFHAANDIVTVAIFAPNGVMRPAICNARAEAIARVRTDRPSARWSVWMT
jgi:WD40 repeat protein